MAAICQVQSYNPNTPATPFLAIPDHENMGIDPPLKVLAHTVA